ncbi:hypothetical protein PINS_up000063 [Pythium insidiosum]|nr:hypothetical protein PINS_up000063 [Pythium insidiosum]
MTGVDANIALQACVVDNNTAQTGGGILADRSTKLYLDNVTFVSNSADLYGGAWIARVKATVQVNDVAATHNTALSGGAFAVTGASVASVETSTFTSNTATQRGGAGFISGDVMISINASHFSENQANLGGAVLVETAKRYALSASQLLRNTALSRGGALYYSHVEGLNTSDITCAGNTAPSGGCIFWLTYSADDLAQQPPPVPCANCTMRDNSVYNVATNSRRIEVQWWPTNVTRGVFIMEPPDEESFEALNDTRTSVAAKRLIWPRLQAVDIYGQIEVLDVTTRCVATGVPRSLDPNATTEDHVRLSFRPGGYVKAVAGVVSFREATFVAAPRPLPYVVNVTCILPEKKTLWLARDVVMERCAPGYSTENTYVYVETESMGAVLMITFSLNGEGAAFDAREIDTVSTASSALSVRLAPSATSSCDARPRQRRSSTGRRRHERMRDSTCSRPPPPSRRGTASRASGATRIPARRLRRSCHQGPT